MICLIGKRPILRIGPHHQVIGYDTEWIDRAIRRAAMAAGRDDFPCVEDITIGIVHYLENSCPLSLLPIEDLYVRIDRMLRRISCDAIADQLTVLSPPVTLSLASTLRELDFGFELGFFQQLHGQLEELHCYGVEKIKVVEVRDTVLQLRNQTRWTRNCDALATDILSFIETFNATHTKDSRAIRLTVEPIF